MSDPIVLPTPLPFTALSPGQLLIDPLNPSHSAFTGSSSLTLNEPVIRNDYRDHLTHDAEGRLISSIAARTPSSYESENSVHLQADQSCYHSLNNPTSAFNTLRRNTDSQDYFRRIAKANQTVYYVTSVQKLRNPSFSKASPASPSATAYQQSKSKIALPTYSRRDSTLDVSESSNDAILSVSLLKVRCLLGSPSTPHSIGDVDYAWTYHMLDDDVQLSIGLGKALRPAEFRKLACIVADEDFADGYEDGDEWDGVGGF